MSVITDAERNYLLDKMENLLNEYDYDYTEEALNKIIDTWSINKAPFIEAFKRHPNYIEGKFMIAFDQDYERMVSTDESFNFSVWLDYVIRDRINEVPQEIINERTRQSCTFLPSFLFAFLTHLDRYSTRTISERTAAALDKNCPGAHIHAGMKTSRAVNKICTYLGYNKENEYNKRYAKYADSLSPLKIVRHTVLSFNPLDYLTMSFGNSWASCHTIDKANKRHMPNSYEGQYSSGTISYMLDASSMVFYTVDKSYNGDEYFTQPKIVRQMFHYGEEKLIQGRLYPQSYDYNGQAMYTDYRNIVQKIISEIFNFPNLWTVTHGTDAASRYICSHGTHYRDYCYYDECTLSRIKGSENECCFDVGHAPICIKCGQTHDISENINCCATNGYYCTECGEWIDEDDVCWVGDEPYCSDCVTYCDCCDTYDLNENMVWIDSEGRYICSDCANRYYVQCEDCYDYIPSDEAVCAADGRYICQSCFEEYYAVCNECGEVYPSSELQELDNCYYCPDCYEEKTNIAS